MFDLHPSAGEVQRKRHKGEAALRDAACEPVYFLPVKQELAGAPGLVVGPRALEIGVAPGCPRRSPRLFLRGIRRDAGRTVKVLLKVGDRSVDVEYSPHQMSGADVNALVASLTGSLEGKTT